MIGDFFGFLLGFVTNPGHTIVALVAGAFLHVTLRSLWLKISAKAKAEITSIAPKA
jgi:hypothetical protein